MADSWRKLGKNTRIFIKISYQNVVESTCNINKLPRCDQCNGSWKFVALNSTLAWVNVSMVTFFAPRWVWALLRWLFCRGPRTVLVLEACFGGRFSWFSDPGRGLKAPLSREGGMLFSWSKISEAAALPCLLTPDMFPYFLLQLLLTSN